jgi:hypothetical protein
MLASLEVEAFVPESLVVEVVVVVVLGLAVVVFVSVCVAGLAV